MRAILTVFIFTLLLSLSAGQLHANVHINGDGIGGNYGGSNISWKDIMDDPRFITDFPHYNIKGKSIPYNELCLINDMLVRNVHPVRINEDDEDAPLCYITEDTIRGHRVCTERTVEGCARWGYFEETYIPNKMVLTIYVEDSYYGTMRKAFSKSYSLPHCAPAIPGIEFLGDEEINP